MQCRTLNATFPSKYLLKNHHNITSIFTALTFSIQSFISLLPFQKQDTGSCYLAITPWTHSNLPSLTCHHFTWPLQFVYWHFPPIHWASCRPGYSPFQRLQNLTHQTKKNLAYTVFAVLQIIQFVLHVVFFACKLSLIKRAQEFQWKIPSLLWHMKEYIKMLNTLKKCILYAKTQQDFSHLFYTFRLC